MAITLKKLVETARRYYELMEKNRPGINLIGLVTTPVSKLFVFDQLLEQYATDPEYVSLYEYKDKKPGQTPDQVVAEIIEKDLALGISESEVEVMKVYISTTPPATPTKIETFLKILDNCAKAAHGDLVAVDKAKANIAELATAYKKIMGALDTKDELLTQANIFLDERAVLIAHQQEIAELKLQHQRQTEVSLALISRLTINTAFALKDSKALEADKEKLIEESEAKFTFYESEIKQLKQAYKTKIATLQAKIDELHRIDEHHQAELQDNETEIQKLKQEYNNLNGSYEALKYRHAQNNMTSEQQITELGQLLERMKALQETLQSTSKENDQLKSDVTGLVEKVGILSKQLQDTTDYNMSLSDMTSELTESLERALQDLEQKQQQLATALEEKAQLAPQVDELLTEVGARDTELAEQAKTLKELTTQVEKLKAALASANTEKQSLQQALNKATKLTASVQEDYQRSIREVAQRDNTITGLEAQMDGLQLQLFEAQQATETMNKKDRAAQDPFRNVEGEVTGKTINGYPVGSAVKSPYGTNPALLLTAERQKNQRKNARQVAPLISTNTVSGPGNRK